MSTEKSPKFYYSGGCNPPAPKFYIVSEWNNKVLEINGGDNDEGAYVVMWEKRSPQAEYQLWYAEQFGKIFSAVKSRVIDSKDKPDVRMARYDINGRKSQNWSFDGSKLVNEEGECLSNKGQDSTDGARVVSCEYGGHQWQHWRQEFL